MKKWFHGSLLLAILAVFIYATVHHHGKAEGTCLKEWQINLAHEAKTK